MILEKIDQDLLALAKQSDNDLKDIYAQVDELCLVNSNKVLSAFIENQVSYSDFTDINGYGNYDEGRDKLERIFASILGCEDALVRPQIMSGTNALYLTLSALLKHGDTMISISGEPYDSLQEMIGISGDSNQSLKAYGVNYEQIDLIDNEFDEESIVERLQQKNVKLVEIQRSRGYSQRLSLTIDKIESIIHKIREVNQEVIIMVDNCYGEFVETIEPSDVGADMTVGSLIKNPGGGLAPIGGYIAGREDLIDACGYRLTSPGLGREVGASLGVMKDFYQGLFLAPTVSASALKGAIFAANIYEKLGFPVIPNGTESRHDIIQAVEFGIPEGVIEFCKGIQAAAPVDSYVTPEPWPMPGYDSDVIMAAGAFVQGSSIELSADGPIKPPYAVYFQGGLTWPHAKLGILMSLEYLVRAGIVTL